MILLISWFICGFATSFWYISEMARENKIIILNDVFWAALYFFLGFFGLGICFLAGFCQWLQNGKAIIIWKKKE
jgi:hypothetical protein